MPLATPPTQTTRRIVVLRPGQLTADQVAAWSAIQTSLPDLDTPFLSPGFAQVLDRVRDGVRVAVVEENGLPVAFFPHQEHIFGLGAPLGAHGRLPISRPLGMSDHQGLIGSPGLQIDAAELVAACGLRCWSFDHLLAADDRFAAHHVRVKDSPIIEVSAGAEAWAEQSRATGSQLVRELARKRRRLERELGEIRFVAHSRETEHLETLIRWKRAQYRRTGSPDRFRQGWIGDLVRALHATPEVGVLGRLSVLFAGDRMVAAHMGLQSSRSWHWWLPSFDPAHGRNSPGQLLLLEMVRACESLGVERIDLGAGQESYKDRFSTGRVLLAEGRVGDLPPPAAAVQSARAAIGSRPLVAESLRAAARVGRRLRGRTPGGAA